MSQHHRHHAKDDATHNHDSCRLPANDDAPRKKPGFLKAAFQKAVGYIRDGGMGALVSHFVTCVALPTALGTAFSGSMMTGAMLVTSPLLAFGIGYGIHRLQGHKPSLKSLAGSAAFAFAVACAYVGFVGHDSHEHRNVGPGYEPIECRVPETAKDTVLSEQAAYWFNHLDSTKKEMIVRNANILKMTLPEYLNGGCYPPIPMDSLKTATPKDTFKLRYK